MDYRTPLSKPRVWALAALLALCALLPALPHGLESADHFLRANLTRDTRLPELHTASWDGFHFFPPAARSASLRLGYAPWWGVPDGHAHHMRPLSSWTHALDFRAWPTQPWLMHLHSALYYAALCALVALLYRQLLGGPAWGAGLAALFFSIDYTHGMVTAWIANRNALLSASLGFAALLLHHRSRIHQNRIAAWLAPLCLAGALASGEVALSIVAFFAAYAVTLDDSPPRARLRRYAPYVIVLAAWAIAFKRGHFGVTGSGIYLDPNRQTGPFLRQLPIHWLLGIAAELGGPGPDAWPLLPAPARTAFVVIGLTICTVATVVFLPLLRREAGARFFALGAALAMVPVSATFPSSRLLLVPGFGLIALAARAIVAWRDGEPWLPARGAMRSLTRGYLGLVGVVHLILSPPLFLVLAHQAGAADRATQSLVADIPHDSAIRQQDLVIVNLPDVLFQIYVRPTLATRNAPIPAGVTLLGIGIHTLDITRLDDRTLVVQDAAGFYGEAFSLLHRPLDLPIPVGTRIDAGPFAAVVEAADSRTLPTGTPALLPTRVRFQFAAPLESPSLRWLVWDGQHLQPWTPPPPGGHVTLPAHPHPLLPLPPKQPQ